MVSDEIAKIQRKLHDSGSIWSSAELIRWFNDGYRQLLSQSKAVKRFWNFNVPSGFNYSHSHEWEDKFGTGTKSRFTHSVLSGQKAATYFWETEFLEGITPNNSNACTTQPWERVHSGEWDGHFRFALPRDHERIRRVAWDEKRLTPVTVKELDNIEWGWNRERGEPVVFTAGVGKNKTFEIFEIRTDYIQGYELREFERGIPRQVSGDRTYVLSVGGRPPENTYAYATSGDMEGLTGKSYGFSPTSAHTYDWEKTDGHTIGNTPFKFTWEGADSQDQPSQTLAGTQPWEIENRGTGGIFGTFPDEHAFGAGTKVYADEKPRINGIGWRFTKPAANTANGFAVHIWEKEQLDGNTTFTDSTTIGTYRWESEFGATSIDFATGVLRGVSSPDRQYMPVHLGVTAQRILGTVRDWRTSNDAVSVLQVVIPDAELNTNDNVDLIPAQMLKYIHYYVWSRAFGRQGEGHNAILADHFEQRFKRGVQKFMNLSNLAYRDLTYSRESAGVGTRRPPRVRFPAEFPRVF